MCVVIAMIQSARCGCKDEQCACWSEGWLTVRAVGSGDSQFAFYSDDLKCTLWL